MHPLKCEEILKAVRQIGQGTAGPFYRCVNRFKKKSAGDLLFLSGNGRRT